MSNTVDGRRGVQKLATGIESFDAIAQGGLPQNRTTLISGTAGSGKTVFAVANHFSSKGGDQPLFGRFQPPERVTEVQRQTVGPTLVGFTVWTYIGHPDRAREIGTPQSFPSIMPWLQQAVGMLARPG